MSITCQRSAALFVVPLVASLWTGCFGHDAYEPGRACAPGETRVCETDPAGDDDGGPCTRNVQSCLEDASGWGECHGPVNDDGEDCACTPGHTEICYGGPDGTEGVGQCEHGLRTCEGDGLSYGVCEGQVLPANEENCDAPGDEDCDGVACSEPVWAVLFGDAPGETSGDQAAQAVAVGPGGELFVAFEFTGSVQLGATKLTSAGARDLAVAKLDPDGSLVWGVSIGGEDNEFAGGLAVGGDGHPVLFGTYESSDLSLAGTPLMNDGSGADAFVAKLGAETGTPLWAQRVGVLGDFLASGVAVAPESEGELARDILLAGSFKGTLVCSPAISCDTVEIKSTEQDAFVQRLSADGSTIRWTRTVVGPADEAVNAVAIAEDGDVLVAGSLSGDAKLGNMGLTTTAPDDQDAFLAKLSRDGEPLWARRFGDSALQGAIGVAVAPDGTIAVVGLTNGAIDFGPDASVPAPPASQAFVAKVAADGSGLWARGYPGQPGTYARAAAFDLDGSLVVAGGFRGATDFGTGDPMVADSTDAFLLSLDSQGVYRWARRFGVDGKADSGNALAILPDGHVLFAGAFHGTVDFGLGELTSAGDLDAGLALFQP